MSITSLVRQRQFLWPVVAVLLVVGGCEQSKSSNPLSPLIAGPIAGVTISLPKSLEPGAGWKIEDRHQPLTLLMENPSSNSPRPFTLRLQIASDSGFGVVVHSVAGLEPGSNGRTSYRLPDKLAHGHTYHWRVRAEDGANSSDWSATTSFEILTPIVIGVPIPASPIGGGRITSRQPTLTVTNGLSSGPHAPLYYLFQLSTAASFGDSTASAETLQSSSGTTTMAVPSPLPYDTQLYWRVRISDGANTGNWSATESFRTPLAPPPPPPTPGPGPVSGAPCTGSPEQIVTCSRNRFAGQMSTDQILQFLELTARDLTSAGVNGAPFGMLVKTSGHQCNGYSCDILCSGNGSGQRQWDILGDAEGAQYPVWVEITGPKVVRQCVIR
ncbi:MAG: hypothetical protein FJW21_05460 [Acidimicrobiia bacterium]|nr:hypothetical protein [Acidimicrobiia bacterium]